HLPLDHDAERARRKREHAKLMTDARWERRREERDANRAAVWREVADEMGPLTPRELLLLAPVTYSCDGEKAKPWRPNEALRFINSDPVLIELFLRFVEAEGIGRGQLKYRLSIHESAALPRLRTGGRPRSRSGGDLSTRDAQAASAENHAAQY